MADTNQLLASIATGKDKKNDAVMMMSSDANWGQLLTPGPYAIALLGDLILIATQTDFSLEEKAPAEGYKYLSYPNSFRACLVQVSNGGYDAFNTAHTNMDGIREYCGNVDGHVRDAVRFLLEGTTEEVQKILPMSLKKIQEIADNCLVLVQEVEGKFVGLMELIAELIAASTNAKGLYEKKEESVKMAIKVAKIDRERLNKAAENSKKRLEDLNKEVKDNQEQFKKAIDSIPSGGEILKLMACEVLVDGLRNAIGIGTHYLDQKLNHGTSSGSGNAEKPSGSGNPTGSSYKEGLSKQRVYKSVDRIYKNICTLYEISTAKVDQNKKYSPDWKKVSGKEGNFIIMSIEGAKKDVDSEIDSGDVGKRVSSVCQEAISVCKDMRKIAENLAADTKGSKVADLIQRVRGLKRTGQSLDAEAKSSLRTDPLNTKPPYLSKVPPQSHGSSVAETATANAKYKTKIAKAALDDAKKRQEAENDELKMTNEKLTKVLKTMATMKMDEISFDAIHETLIKGIKALASLRKQWGKLVLFFEKVTHIVKICLNSPLIEFVDEVKTGREIKLANHTIPLYNVFKDVIFEHASKSSQLSYVVETIADAYFKISEKHLMGKVTALNELIALDPTTDKNKIAIQRTKLYEGCSAAQKDFQKIVNDEKRIFSDNIDARIAKIKEIEDKLPPIAEIKDKEIQQAVTDGFDRAKAQRPKPEKAWIDKELDELV